MSSRQPRRQGVVYGPVRPPDSGRDVGSILGRVLGVLVIVLAVGVLGGGALAFINGRPPEATGRATPSPIAFLSPSPTLPPAPTPGSDTPSPTVPSVTPSPSPGTESPTPSAGATPFVPLVEIGPGFVTFGTRSDGDLNITDPQATLPLDQRARWSAHLTEPADSSDLRVIVSKIDPEAPGGERLVRDDEVKPDVNGAQIFLRRFRPGRLLEGAGIYAVRYLRGDELMAEGYVRFEE